MIVHVSQLPVQPGFTENVESVVFRLPQGILYI